MISPLARRLAAALALAVLLLPSLVQARPLPSETRRAPGRAESGFLQWIWSTLGSIWTKGGAPADLNGSTPQTENGSQLDPSGATSPGENGPGLDPNGRA